MKRKRFSEEQIVGKGVPEACREQGIVENTSYRWRRKYGGVSVPEVRRLRDQGLSERQACRRVGVSRSTALYRPHRRDDAPLAERLRKLAEKTGRSGYWRASATLRRAGERINHKRVYRV